MQPAWRCYPRRWSPSRGTGPATTALTLRPAAYVELHQVLLPLKVATPPDTTVVVSETCAPETVEESATVVCAMGATVRTYAAGAPDVAGDADELPAASTEVARKY